jgi:RimJ/RimL family protein N-acetyltransferase
MFINESISGFHFRSMTADDKELFFALQAEASEVADFYRKYPETLLISMNRHLNDANEHDVVVFQEPDEEFIGICSFQRLQEPTLELGYDLVKEKRGKGIGTEMVRAFIMLAHAHFPDREIIIKIREENMASRRVAEKCGATFVGLTDAPEVDTIQRLLEENKELSHPEEAKAAMERGRNAVRIYKVK